MNEHGFVKAVHRRLPPSVYRWKIADRYTNGVPDAWYSGTTSDLWVEYKYLPSTPTRPFKIPLTQLQLAWLNTREAEGRAVSVIVGCPAGAVVLAPSACKDRINIDVWQSINEVATWITTQTTC